MLQVPQLEVLSRSKAKSIKLLSKKRERQPARTSVVRYRSNMWLHSNPLFVERALMERLGHDQAVKDP
jgi:hypothetical protein